jgi:sugar/nucleoside kinase (ribokinase family)
VDVLSRTDDAFLQNNHINKGAMTLIEAEEVKSLYAKMGPGVEMSGGSAANTVAAFASLGGKVGYIGKVADDQLGEVFRHDIRSVGAVFNTPPLRQGAPTARCLILITPDAQRTMCTYLGACVLLTPEDLDEAMIRSAKVTYLEGYLFDRDHAKQAFRQAGKIAHAAGRKVALTLSDPFCVERHRDEFLDLVKNHVDILFANEAEILSLYKTDKLSEAVAQVGPHCEVAVITRSAKGSVIISGNEMIEVAAEPVSHVVDTTGAGDLYAAGFLYGYTQGKNLAQCGRIASIAAAEIIAQVGARPQRSLSQLLKDKKAA